MTLRSNEKKCAAIAMIQSARMIFLGTRMIFIARIVIVKCSLIVKIAKMSSEMMMQRTWYTMKYRYAKAASIIDIYSATAVMSTQGQGINAMKNLKYILSAKPADLKNHYKLESLLKSDILYYKDNNSRILGVAHLDSCNKFQDYVEIEIAKNKILFSQTLDDRLGAWLLLELLLSLNIKFDILLTSGEEIGQSTATEFKTQKKYNWIFSFDRTGTDVVMYQYETQKLIGLLKNYNFVTGFGSFSDISYMEHLKCKGFNFGTCYYNYHSKLAYANLTELKTQVKKFLKFYHNLKSIHLKHTEVIKHSNLYNDYYHSDFRLLP